MKTWDDEPGPGQWADWIATERFDLSAEFPIGVTASQIPEMLQAFPL
jgi:uncharacterized protein (TIGR03435 family)